MISNERVRRKYPVQNITIIQYRSPVVRSPYELCGSGSVSVARHAGHRLGRCFQGSGAISSRLCSSALCQDCCVRSDLAAFTSADAFSGRSEGTVRVSSNMRANNSEMLREVAIASRAYLDARFHKFSRRAFPLATLWDRIGRPTRATPALPSTRSICQIQGPRRRFAQLARRALISTQVACALYSPRMRRLIRRRPRPPNRSADVR
jgi:hypothetical protein